MAKKKAGSGVILADATYSLSAIAEAIDRTEEWVIEHVIDGGCRARKIGHVYLISGQSFQLWAENGAEVGTNKDRNRRSREAASAIA